MMRCWYSLVFALLANSLFAVEFVCQKKISESSDYLHCINKISNYPNPVHFYYPKKSIEITHVNIHFHGHNIEGFDHLKNFGEMLVQSELNSILVVPESIGKCETYDGFFKSKVNGINFLKDVIALNNIQLSTLSFSGHSGAYRVLRTLFAYEDLEKNIGLKLIGVGLFDATYSEVDSIVNFGLKNKDFIFYNSFVDGEKGTADEISRLLQKKNFYFFPVESNSATVLFQHFDIINTFGIRNFLKLLK
jgi:hypothetical protein